MAYVTTGLPNNGRTKFFNFRYDDALSRARGLDVASYMMNYCDDDLSLLAGWFSSRQLDTPPPINVSIDTVAVDANGNPTGGVGATPVVSMRKRCDCRGLAKLFRVKFPLLTTIR
jgi:hypothetical protein